MLPKLITYGGCLKRLTRPSCLLNLPRRPKLEALFVQSTTVTELSLCQTVYLRWCSYVRGFIQTVYVPRLTYIITFVIIYFKIGDLIDG